MFDLHAPYLCPLHTYIHIHTYTYTCSHTYPTIVILSGYSCDTCSESTYLKKQVLKWDLICMHHISVAHTTYIYIHIFVHTHLPNNCDSQMHAPYLCRSYNMYIGYIHTYTCTHTHTYPTIVILSGYFCDTCLNLHIENNKITNESWIACTMYHVYPYIHTYTRAHTLTQQLWFSRGISATPAWIYISKITSSQMSLWQTPLSVPCLYKFDHGHPMTLYYPCFQGRGQTSPVMLFSCVCVWVGGCIYGQTMTIYYPGKRPNQSCKCNVFVYVCMYVCMYIWTAYDHLLPLFPGKTPNQFFAYLFWCGWVGVCVGMYVFWKQG